MKQISLGGNWQFRDTSCDTFYPVEVPGTVLSGMLANNLIEDPFYRMNEYPTRELFWKDYEFVRNFCVEKSVFDEDSVTLVCEGLDTLCDIYINDKLIAKTDNMHRTWRFAVKEYLQAGENTIRILFRSVLQYIKDYECSENKKADYIPSGCMEGNELLRKAHSMFGWDWGPQTIDAGIFRSIYLETHSVAKMEDLRIRQAHADGEVTLDISAAVEMYQCALSSIPKLEVKVTIEELELAKSDDGMKEISAALVAEDTAEVKADGTVALSLQVKNPKLWWPNGYGEQNLYRVKASLVADSQEVLMTEQKRIGLRTLTVSQDKDQWGNEFAFIVNGLKIFTRGGNYIPDDCLYTRISRAKMDYLLESCKRANFNCVRIWGGGYYPSDEFYDLCDEKGLIVWQDLMYACNVYNVTDEFAENARQEAVDNVKRLRHHASLGLWCGNNEIESAWSHWGDFQRQTMYLRADYIKLFEDVLPKAVKENDGDTFYWPSSPSSGGCIDAPDSEDRGDNHYWDVWHGQKPFTDYQKYYFRFCSEFGFQSFPCYKTVKTFAEDKDCNIFSRVMESHQKNDAANGKMLYYLSENLQYPKDFPHLLYASQILQGMAIKSGVDHWRRHRGRCMGTLYWQINDDWPAPSWSSIDYFGRWKALHYMAKKFYAPFAISMNREQDCMKIYLENEGWNEESGMLEVYVKTMDCNAVVSHRQQVMVDAFSSADVFTLDLKEFEGKDEQVFVEAVIRTESGKVCRDVETLLPYKHVELPKVNVNVEVSETDEQYEIKVSADGFAPFTCLDFDDVDVIFSDNYFHLTQPEGEVITLNKKDIYQGSIADADDLRAKLRVTSLGDAWL